MKKKKIKLKYLQYNIIQIIFNIEFMAIEWNERKNMRINISIQNCKFSLYILHELQAKTRDL